MKNILLTFFELVFLITVSFGQNQLSDQQREIFDSKYGIDVLLHVGKIFYPESNIASGNPYWGTENIYKGDIVFDGKRYSNQQLMYNIYLQNFVLIFNDTNGAEKQIVLDTDRIDSVLINEFVFIKNTLSQIDKKFIQKVHQGKIPCYVVWEKQRTIKSETEIKGYSYSKEKATKYFVYNSVLYRFKNNRQLLKIFQQEYRKDIKQYLLEKNIRIKTINTQQMKLMVEYIERVVYKS